MKPHPDDSTFKAAWIGIDLRPWRIAPGRYSGTTYASLPKPPPKAVTDGFSYLRERHTRRSSEQAHRWVDWLSSMLADRGWTVPPGLVEFYTDGALIEDLPSTTACYFHFEHELIELDSGHVLVPFYIDQQWISIWCLCFDPVTGEATIVGGDHPNEFEGDAPQLFRVAYSFSEFIWRWWIENSLWYRLMTHWGPFDASIPFEDAEFMEYIAPYTTRHERAGEQLFHCSWDAPKGPWHSLCGDEHELCIIRSEKVEGWHVIEGLVWATYERQAWERMMLVYQNNGKHIGYWNEPEPKGLFWLPNTHAS